MHKISSEDSIIKLSGAWASGQLIKQTLAAFKASIRRLDELISPALTVIHDGLPLSIPYISRENVFVDHAAKTVTLNMEPPHIQWNMADSIAGFRSFTIPLKGLRRFPHDFAFALFSNETDTPLWRHFPLLDDGYDHKTPDIIVDTPDMTMILEFATTRNPSNEGLWKQSAAKRSKYEKAIMRRIFENRRRNAKSKKYGFCPLVCNENSLLTGVPLLFPKRVVSEICARYRFVLEIVRICAEKGT